MADKRRVSESEQLVNLWGHEATRTFSDRLVNLEDKEWFVEQVKAATSPLYLPISPYISLYLPCISQPGRAHAQPKPHPHPKP